MLAFSGRGEVSRKQMATFLKTAIELSVYIYIKKVAEKEALLWRGDAIADFCFWKIGVCVSEQSQFRRSAPYKSDQQRQEKDKRTSYNQQGFLTW